MKNKLTDLNDHLFAQLERLSDEDLKPSELQHEVNRGAAICQVAKSIITNGQLVLKAEQFKQDVGELRKQSLPKMIGGDRNG